MADRTTVIEIKMDASELFEIVKNWANTTKFSVHVNDENKIMYFKNISFNRAWLVVENMGENAKVTAWLAPKGLDPNKQGNAWTGWKIPVPNSFAIGPALVYKKDFRSLVETLESKTGSVIKPNKVTSIQFKTNRDVYVIIIIVFGVLNLLNGLLGLFNSAIASSTIKGAQELLLNTGMFHALMGVILMLTANLLKKGKLLAIWLYAFSILLSIAYYLLMGYRLPYLTIVIYIGTLSSLWKLKKDGEIS